MKVTWILESDVFPRSHTTLRDAILSAKHELIDWNDDWWLSESWPSISTSAVIFHGSLNSAARIKSSRTWKPRSFCNASAFHCSSWYPSANDWLIHRKWRCVSAYLLVSQSDEILRSLDSTEAVFVRPDSPLKPFSGRVLQRDQVSLKALDHGFYFDDDSIPVIVAPVRRIEREWRYVIVDRSVVAGSAYEANGRVAIADDPSGHPWNFAQEIASKLTPPEPVYVLDLCESDNSLYLLELNPFSGADLYSCKADDVVAAVSRVALAMAT